MLRRVSHDYAALFAAVAVLLFCDCDEALLEAGLVVNGAGNALVFGVVGLVLTFWLFGRQDFWFWLFFDGRFWLFLLFGFCLFNFFFLFGGIRLGRQF